MIKKNKFGKIIEKKIKIRILAISLVVIFLLSVISLIGIIYFFPSAQKSFPGKLIEKVSYPVVLVDNFNVIYNFQIKQNLSALKKFYENQDFSKIGMRIDFSTDDGLKRLRIKEKDILNKAIEDEAVKLLVKKRGIKITPEEINEVVAVEVEKNQTKEKFQENLEKIYGWNLAIFKKQIIEPSLYAKKLEEQVAEEISLTNKDAEALIKKAKSELENGLDFSEAARIYSQGSSAEMGGEFGWIADNQLLPEISQTLAERSDFKKNNFEIIESYLGYHIIEVEERKKEGAVDMLKIKQIFVQKKTFGDWLDEQMKNMPVNVLIPGYDWNKEDAIIEFSDLEMKEFEKKIQENPEGDVSMIF